MTTRMVDHSKEFAKLLDRASAEGIARCTERYQALAKQAVSVPNPGVRISAKEMRKQATKQLGQRLAGLVTIKKTNKKTGEQLKSTQWYDKRIDTNRKSATIYPYASKPGEPPRKRTGAGWKGIQFEIDRSIPAGRVGVLPNVKYMVYLNFGTKTIAARPWIEVTLKRHEKLLAMMLQTGAKQGMKGN